NEQDQVSTTHKQRLTGVAGHREVSAGSPQGASERAQLSQKWSLMAWPSNIVTRLSRAQVENVVSCPDTVATSP
ncbi:MAG: hypothetical protein ACI91B_002048, partial [Planctomycetota bacterium]